MAPTVGASAFYGEYHGHKVAHLERIIDPLRGERSVAYLVGDSTLDNKHWIPHDAVEACNGYERVLDPPRSRADVCYWVNRECERRGLGGQLCCVNAAIEESTLGLRAGGALLPQDAFVRGHVGPKDVIVASCGGNDIALRPTKWTAVSMLVLLCCPKWLIHSGLAPGLGHFVRLFRDAAAEYLEELVAERRPRAIIACMLYYLDTRPGDSWADVVLEKLGYNSDPSKLQLVMRKVFELGVSGIRVDGVPVLPVALYEALDGTDTLDYVQRVEPSAQGGEKMARLLLDQLELALRSQPLADQPADCTDARTAPMAAMPGAVHVNQHRGL
jgi:hypothetical protein